MNIKQITTSLHKSFNRLLVIKGLRHLIKGGPRHFIRLVLTYFLGKLSIQKLDNISYRFDPNTLFKGLRLELKPKNFGDKNIYLLTDQTIASSNIGEGVMVISSSKNLTKDVIENSVFYVYFLCDSDALPEIRNIVDNGGIFIPAPKFSNTEYRFVNRFALNALMKTYSKIDRISHFNTLIHENICEALFLTRNLDGDYVEIGVYLGGSALTAVNFLEELNSLDKKVNSRRKAWLVDTYDGFSYDEAESSADAYWFGSHKLYGPEKTMAYVEQTLSGIKVDVELVRSNICAAPLPNGINKIAVANIDVDIYDATLAALKKVSPLVVPGGVIICEDASATPALYGALLAVEEFLETDEGQAYLKIFKIGQYFLIKSSALEAST